MLHLHVDREHPYQAGWIAVVTAALADALPNLLQEARAMSNITRRVSSRGSQKSGGRSLFFTAIARALFFIVAIAPTQARADGVWDSLSVFRLTPPDSRNVIQNSPVAAQLRGSEQQRALRRGYEEFLRWPSNENALQEDLDFSRRLESSNGSGGDGNNSTGNSTGANASEQGNTTGANASEQGNSSGNSTGANASQRTNNRGNSSRTNASERGNSTGGNSSLANASQEEGNTSRTNSTGDNSSGANSTGANASAATGNGSNGTGANGTANGSGDSGAGANVSQANGTGGNNTGPNATNATNATNSSGNQSAEGDPTSCANAASAALHRIGASMGAATPDETNCPSFMISNETCQAICAQGDNATGHIQCMNGEVRNYSICVGGKSANLTVQQVQTVSATLDVSISGNVSKSVLANGIATALGVHNSTVSVELEAVTEGRLLMTIVRRLTATNGTKYQLKYMVAVLEDGSSPSADAILASSANLTKANSSIQTTFMDTASEAGVTMNSIAEVHPPKSRPSVVVINQNGHVQFVAGPASQELPTTTTTTQTFTTAATTVLVIGATTTTTTTTVNRTHTVNTTTTIIVNATANETATTTPTAGANTSSNGTLDNGTSNNGTSGNTSTSNGTLHNGTLNNGTSGNTSSTTSGCIPGNGTASGNGTSSNMSGCTIDGGSGDGTGGASGASSGGASANGSSGNGSTSGSTPSSGAAGNGSDSTSSGTSGGTSGGTSSGASGSGTSSGTSGGTSSGTASGTGNCAGWSSWSPCEPPQSAKPWSGSLKCVQERTFTNTAAGAGCPLHGAVEAQECTTSSGMCAPPGSTTAAPGNTTTAAPPGEAVDSEVGSMARKTAPTCAITAEPKPDTKGVEAVKGFISSQKVGDKILEAKGADPGFLVYGLSGLAMAPPFMAPLIGLVLALFCSACNLSKVLSRKCRRCCGTRKLCRLCCGERQSIARVMQKKKILIIVFTLLGVGGMAAMSQVGTLAPKGADASLKDGFSSGKNADCAASLFVDYMLHGYDKETNLTQRRLNSHEAASDATSTNQTSSTAQQDSTNGTSSAEPQSSSGEQPSSGQPASSGQPEQSSSGTDQSSSAEQTVVTRDTSPPPPAGEFLGLDRAAQTLDFMGQELTAASQLATQVIDVDAAVDETMIRLGHMHSTLGSQVNVQGHQCEFCKFCCGSGNPFVTQIRSALTDSNVKALGEGMHDSTLEDGAKAVQSASSVVTELQTAIGIGPAAAVINSKDFFVNEGMLGPLGLAFLGGLGLAGLGALGMLYAFKCCTRCKCARKEHPAPQFAACGWCGGCLGAILAFALAGLSWFVAGVSTEVCMFMDEVVTESGLKTYATPLGLGSALAQSSYRSCLSPNVSGSRDLYANFGLDPDFQALTVLNSHLEAVRGGTEPAMQRLDILVNEANAKATRFSPAWTSTSQVYTCEYLTYVPAASDTEHAKVTINPQPCTPTEFGAHQKTLATKAQSTLKLAVNAIQGGTKWNTISSTLQAVRADSDKIKGHLNCDPVYTRYKGLHSQVCGGLPNSYWNAGMGWCLAGAMACIAGFAQYKLWKHLRDNRSLYFDDHPDERPTGCKRMIGCFFGVAVGEPGEDESETPLAGGEEGSKGCCGRRNRGDDEPKPEKKPKKKKGKGDPAADRITAKFNGAFDISVEEAIKQFLVADLYQDYDPAFLKAAVEQRASSLQAKDDKKKKKGKKGPEVDPVMPEEPPGGDPKALFENEYSDFDENGMPKADLEGNALDKKTLAKVKKQFDPVKKAWDKYLADKKAYETFALGKARRETLEEGAEVQYPEDIVYLRPISTKTNKPLKVILKDIPEDPSKAVFSDELTQVVGPPIDVQIRKQKPIIPKFKGLSDRCFESTKAELISKLMNLCKSDPAIWEGCEAEPKKAKKAGKEPQPPKEPKGLVNPAEMFQTGTNADKYGEFDDDGVPKTKAGGDELKEKEINGLKKQQEKAKAVWDKHQAAVAKYEADLEAFKAANAEEENPSAEEDVGGIPDEQKEQSCATAGQTLVGQLVDKLVAEHVDELAARVNRGEDDTEELKAILVTEVLEEEEIITDPVLKAFRRFDEERTNACSAGDLKGIFEALGEDELEVETHKFYSEVTEDEINWSQSKMEKTGAVTDGQLQYTGLKAFIEEKDVAVLAGKEPSNLVSALMAMRLDAWMTDPTLDNVWSPRTWRAKLGEEFGESSPKDKGDKGKKRSSKIEKKKETNEEEEEAEAQGNEEEEDGEESGRKKGRKSTSKGEDKKDKKKKDEEEPAKRKSTEKKDKKEKKEKKEEEEEADEGGEVKKEKKEKKEKKSKK